MPTMPTKPGSLPTPVATTANYPAENYPAEYPPGHPLAGTPHPLAGTPVPWSGQPTKDAAIESALAPIGLHPGRPINGPARNSRDSKVDAWLAWLNGGSSAPDADAHVVETDSTGQAWVARLRTGSIRGDDGVAFSSLKFYGGIVDFRDCSPIHGSHQEVVTTSGSDDAWGAGAYVERKTFAGAGSVPSSPYQVFRQITSDTGGPEYFALPADCNVFIEWQLCLQVNTGPAWDPADYVDHCNAGGRKSLRRSGSVFTDLDLGNLDGIAVGGFAPALSFVPKSGDTTEIDMRLTFDNNHYNLSPANVYRAFVDVTIRVVPIDAT